MLVAYVVITVATAIVFACAAVLSIAGHESVLRTAEAVRVPASWMLPLGAVLAAGAVGLLAGFVIPALGTAAACGLVLYFTGAAVAHIRVHDTNVNNWTNWAIFFALAVATLSVALAHHGLA